MVVFGTVLSGVVRAVMLIGLQPCASMLLVAVSAIRYTVVLGRPTGDIHFWILSVIYGGTKVDAVDVAMEERFGEAGKAGWLSLIGLSMFFHDPPVASLLPQPSPFLLTRAWIIGWVFLGGCPAAPSFVSRHCGPHITPFVFSNARIR